MSPWLRVRKGRRLFKGDRPHNFQIAETSWKLFSNRHYCESLTKLLGVHFKTWTSFFETRQRSHPLPDRALVAQQCRTNKPDLSGQPAFHTRLPAEIILILHSWELLRLTITRSIIIHAGYNALRGRWGNSGPGAVHYYTNSNGRMPILQCGE